jgi:pimeloyl-ACP methyl ester carboxylesterase
VIFVAIVVAMFRVAADVRESQDAVAAAGAGALFATVDGRRIHYRAWGPETGRTIMLVHGTLAWSETFRDIAEPLAGLGYRIVAPDLPPFGFSERPTGHDYSRAAQAKRLLAFADAIQLDGFVLGVHSYGGGAAVEAAFVEPERVEGLVLMDVAMGLSQARADIPMLWLLRVAAVREIVVSATLTNPLAIGPGLRAFIYDDSVVTPERVALYRQPSVMRGTTEAIGRWLFTGLLRDESRAASSDPARYRRFEAPVLVIWGRQDTVTPLAQGEALAALFPTAELEVLDGVNHIPHVEKPAEVVRLIDGFVKALPAPEPDPAEDKQDRLEPEPLPPVEQVVDDALPETDTTSP